MIDTTRPFAVIQMRDQNKALVLEGSVRALGSLAEMPRRAGADPRGRRHDTLTLVPFAQVREKGFKAVEGGGGLRCLVVEREREVPLGELLAGLPEAPTRLEGAPQFDETDAQYGAAVADVVEREIGEGERANFLVARTCRARLREWSPAVGLGMLKRLMREDYGAYWKFAVFDGERTLVGSTPETHLRIEAGRVAMNPISGTFRKGGAADAEALRAALMGFLRDPKEINELFMVVDEELKMMSRMCALGGRMVGPLLKEMAHLVHTEYVLEGESGLDVADLLRASMFAATVTGSPLENACRVIARREAGARGYYAGCLALIGRDAAGAPFLDSPILIRTLEVDSLGRAALKVGATLVRDSNPAAEAAETRAKSAAVLGVLAGGAAAPGPRLLEAGGPGAALRERLGERNRLLSPFWLERQEPTKGPGPLTGLGFALVDNEDDFVRMLGHMLRHLGAETRVESWSSFSLERAGADIVVVGPGPGNPAAEADPKMARNMALIRTLLGGKRPFLAVCLGHQLLCRCLGFGLAKKGQPAQGVQRRIDYFGRKEDVGFYNTFCGLAGPARPGLEVSASVEGEIHALRGPHFTGFQFHPESILTTRGLDIVREEALRVARADAFCANRQGAGRVSLVAKEP